MKSKLDIDEEIVIALNFSNLVLLDQCFNQIKYPLISSKNQLQKKTKQSSQKKTKQSGKSKFQKVTKNKTKNIELSNKFQKITLGSTKIHHQDNNQVYSKVKICSDDIDIFSQTSFLTNNNIYTPAKSDQYNINDFINQTAISSSSSKNNFSPINAWKTSSVEKYHPNNFQISSHSEVNFSQKNVINYGKYFVDNYGQKSSKSIQKKQKGISSTKSVSKKNKKFQKIPSTKKTINEKPQQIAIISHQPQQKTDQQSKTQTKLSSLYIHNKQTQNPKQIYTKKQVQFSQQSITANQQQSFYDNQTRDTCELAPSKLQKLMQVQDNKYKEIVLKTFYKHKK